MYAGSGCGSDLRSPLYLYFPGVPDRSRYPDDDAVLPEPADSLRLPAAAGRGGAGRVLHLLCGAAVVSVTLNRDTAIVSVTLNPDTAIVSTTLNRDTAVVNVTQDQDPRQRHSNSECHPKPRHSNSEYNPKPRHSSSECHP